MRNECEYRSNQFIARKSKNKLNWRVLPILIVDWAGLGGGWGGGLGVFDYRGNDE